MAIYSHSKIETFEKCKLKFRYKYIEKIIPKIPKSIEAHVGDIVHRSLEWLYWNVKDGKIPSVTELISFYSKKWEENYLREMKINSNMTLEEYFNRGVEFLVNYYLKYKPFKEETLGIEERIEVNLDDGKKKIVGYIDRLVNNPESNEIEIHDYKTSNSPLVKENIENNRQLALYSLAIKERFGKDKTICLVWHFLAHDMKVCLRKTNEELEKLRQSIIELINEIEATKSFPGTISNLCNWCEYKDICEEWGRREK